VFAVAVSILTGCDKNIQPNESNYLLVCLPEYVETHQDSLQDNGEPLEEWYLNTLVNNEVFSGLECIK
jgi:hypothetical protein